MDYEAIINRLLEEQYRRDWPRKEDPTRAKRQLLELVAWVRSEYDFWTDSLELCARLEQATRLRFRIVARGFSGLGPTCSEEEEEMNEHAILDLLEKDISDFQLDQAKRTKDLDMQGCSIIEAGKKLEEKRDADLADLEKQISSPVVLDRLRKGLIAHTNKRINELNNKLPTERRSVLAIAQLRLQKAMQSFIDATGWGDTPLHKHLRDRWHIAYLRECQDKNPLVKNAREAVRLMVEGFKKYTASSSSLFQNPNLFRIACSVIYGPGAELVIFDGVSAEQLRMQEDHKAALARAASSRARDDDDEFLIDGSNDDEDDNNFGNEYDGPDDEAVSEEDESSEIEVAGQQTNVDAPGWTTRKFSASATPSGARNFSTAAVTIMTVPPVPAPVALSNLLAIPAIGQSAQGMLIDVNAPEASQPRTDQSLQDLAEIDNYYTNHITRPEPSAPNIDALLLTQAAPTEFPNSVATASEENLIDLEGLTLDEDLKVTHVRIPDARLTLDRIGGYLSGQTAPAWDWGAPQKFCHGCKTNDHNDRDCDRPDVASNLNYNLESVATDVKDNPDGSCSHCQSKYHNSNVCPAAFPEMEEDDYCTICRSHGHRNDTCFKIHPGLRAEYKRRMEDRKKREAQKSCEVCGAKGLGRRFCMQRHN